MENFDIQHIDLSMKKYEEELAQSKGKAHIAEQREKENRADQFIAERNAVFNPQQSLPASGGINNSKSPEENMAKLINDKSGRSERTDPNVEITQGRQRIRTRQRGGRTR